MKNCWALVRKFKIATIAGASLLTCGIVSAIVFPIVLRHEKSKYNFQIINGDAAELIASSINMKYQDKAIVAYDQSAKVAQVKITSLFGELPKQDSLSLASYDLAPHIILPTTMGVVPQGGGNEHIYMQDWASIDFTIILDLVNLKCLSCSASQPIVLIDSLIAHIDDALLKNKAKIMRALDLLK